MTITGGPLDGFSLDGLDPMQAAAAGSVMGEAIQQAETRGYQQCLADMRAGRYQDMGLLTEQEHAAIDAAGALWNQLCSIAGHGPTRALDLDELAAHIHAIQRAVMKQAAARAYPDRYRLLGEALPPLVQAGPFRDARAAKR